MNILGIDIGYSNLKLAYGNKGASPTTLLRPAGAAPTDRFSSRFDGKAQDDFLHVQVNGEPFIAGVAPDRAELWSRSLHADYASSASYQALFHAGLLLSEMEHIDILVTGLSSTWASVSNGAVDYPSVWSCDDAKFHWYCDSDPETSKDPEQPKAKQKSKEEVALEELEKMRKSLEAKRALALMQPTPENLKAYITAQEALMDRASVFSDVWRRVIWANPEINYQLRNPVNNAAIQVRDSERTQKERSSLKEIAKEWGIFFVFRTDCPYCHRMAPALKLLSDTYGITIFPVSLDGGALPEFPEPAMDNGMAKVLDVKQVPYVALGNIKDRRLIPLGSGVLSVQDMVERIYILTQTQPGDLY